MNTWYKDKLILLVLLALIVGGFLLFRSGSNNDSNSSTDESTNVSEVRSGEVEVKGAIACLPYRTVSAGQACVKAIKGDDGKVYALSSAEVRGVENTMSEGTKVTGIGTYQPANTSVDDGSAFNYDGVLVLRTLKTR